MCIRDRKRSAFVGDFGNCLNIFNRAKEIRRLNQHAGGIVADDFFEFLQIDAARVSEPDGGQRNLLVGGVGGEHFAILRMNAARDHCSILSGHAHRHHYSFGGSG